MARKTYTSYADVPWYRQSGVNNFFVFLGLLGALPFSVWTCVNLLTGDVYFNKRDENGKLMTWGIVNKLWAVLFAVVWICVFAFMVYDKVAGPKR
jgi:hypothetical protein